MTVSEFMVGKTEVVLLDQPSWLTLSIKRNEAGKWQLVENGRARELPDNHPIDDLLDYASSLTRSF